MFQRIFYQTLNCSYGILLIAANSHGICAIKLGDDSQKLINELHSEFNNHELIQAKTELDQYSKPLLDSLYNKKTLPDLPCDLTGTPFQKQVWQFLKTIPSGKTYSYSDLAKAIGQPKAIRAVASACAKNQIAMIIPCHRIVPKSGGVGQYRWGAERKRKLLSMESL